MKKVFIAPKYKTEINLEKLKELAKDLPKNLAIAYSSQFLTSANKVRKALEKTHNLTAFVQVLGCSNPKLPEETSAILLVGSAKFHAVSLAYESKKDVFVFENNKLTKVKGAEVKVIEDREKASLAKYLHAENVGIIVSTKPGQQNLTRAIDLKNKIKNKNSYLYITNEINLGELENFPDIDSWVNTACPRMDLNDSSIINMNKVREIL